MKLRSLLLLLASLPVFGGGFYLNVRPAGEVHAKSVLLVAQLSGCHEAEKGELTAVAEGMVDGQRKSLPMKVMALRQPGFFTIDRFHSDRLSSEKGHWVIVLTAKHPAFAVPTTTAVPVVDGKLDRDRAKYETRRAFTTAEIDALLRAAK